MKKVFAILAIMLLLPLSAKATLNVDLAISPESIKFSEDVASMTKGDQVRVYAQVSNYGAKDATGNVIFYLDVSQISDQQVSVRSSGLEDDVFADFTVPDHDFRFYIEIKNISPADGDLSNNQALSVFVHPIDPPPPPPPKPVVKEEPVKQQIQKVETKTVTAKPEEKKVTSSAAKTPETTNSSVTAPATTETKDGQAELIPDFYKTPAVESLGIVKINAQQVNWNSYFFTFSTNVKDLDVGQLQYTWDYGDGKTSTLIGNHSFPRSGDYYVTLKVKGPWNNEITDYTTVHVNFWSVYNYWIWLIVLVLILLLFLWGTGWRRHDGGEERPEPSLRREKKQPKLRAEKE